MFLVRLVTRLVHDTCVILIYTLQVVGHMLFSLWSEPEVSHNRPEAYRVDSAAQAPQPGLDAETRSLKP